MYRAIGDDGEANLWIGNINSGLNLFDRNNETSALYFKDYSNSNSLSDVGVFTNFEDRTGVMWVGTWAGGVNKNTIMKN
ncbi:MAG: hypothetical protein U5J96_04030 [Ignavibacteriaceae bacterium]|nr:hypothetical protein [Ignavibacteriaceae bacterium]